MRSGELRLPKLGSGEVRLATVCPTEICPAETSPAEVRPKPGVGGAIEPYFVGPFPDITTARAWAVTDGLDADAAMELVNLKPDTTGAPR